ncbi:hypothetical protein BN2476_1530006 [Paraburkholderia piptadeniae]|uniref:Uncharacterized protein n=1 Tax=Paraburkholderia piptadeniae TaxID=1701573 RepID=A0A1N7SWV6_9BURK|nr:hypothetical protein BN2476_1530006 [Paraburkholderia piptadeniae]
MLRDREQRLPHNKIELFSRSGPWAIAVPKVSGGAGVSFVTLSEVRKIVAVADPFSGRCYRITSSTR